MRAKYSNACSEGFNNSVRDALNGQGPMANAVTFDVKQCGVGEITTAVSYENKDGNQSSAWYTLGAKSSPNPIYENKKALGDAITGNSTSMPSDYAPVYTSVSTAFSDQFDATVNLAKSHANTDGKDYGKGNVNYNNDVQAFRDLGFSHSDAQKLANDSVASTSTSLRQKYSDSCTKAFKNSVYSAIEGKGSLADAMPEQNTNTFTYTRKHSR